MSDTSSSYEEDGWIQWFCSLEDHHFFCEVDLEFIKDSFNLYGLKQKFNSFNDALDMILRVHAPDVNELESEQFLENYQEATDLYGLIHARFILSPRGLSMMKEKFIGSKFGVCPRVMCDRQSVLPIGMAEELRVSRVKVFCPKCEDVFIPKKKSLDIDGAYFGCSFPHVLLQTYSELQPQPLTSIFVPKIFGYKIYKKKGSKYEEKAPCNEITHYDEAQLKKMKSSHSKSVKGEFN